MKWVNLAKEHAALATNVKKVLKLEADVVVLQIHIQVVHRAPSRNRRIICFLYAACQVFPLLEVQDGSSVQSS